MDLSIIIPLYNAEKYIVKCIESALDQDYPQDQYEILVIDDGSTDGSASLVANLAAKHNNIRLISKENEGVSRARNLGVEIAQGEYIMFLDADDFLEPLVLKRLVRTAKQDRLDMLNYHAQYIGENDERKPLWLAFVIFEIPSGVHEGREFMRPKLRYTPVLWAYLFRREFLLENNLKMLPVRYEDEEFIPRAVYAAKRIEAVQTMAYNYLYRPESFMNVHNPQKEKDIMTVCKSLISFADSIRPEEPQIADNLRLKVDKIIFYHLSRLAPVGKKQTLEAVRMFRSAGLIPISNSVRSFRRFLLNRFPLLFYRHYKNKPAKIQ